MKVLIKKLKRSNKVMLSIYTLVIVFFLVTYILFTKSLLTLSGIETGSRMALIILFGMWFLLYLIWNLMLIIQKKKVSFGVVNGITIIFIAVFMLASFSIDKVYEKISSIVQSDTATYTSVLLTMKDYDFSNSSVIGMISNVEDKEGYILPQEIIKKENLNNEIKQYDDYLLMLVDFYNGELDAIFISNNYPVLFGSEEKFENILEDTKIIFSHSKEMKTDESKITSNKSLTEPFTLLLLGVDSDSTNGLNANAAFNGDTIMLITFNPKTLNATIFSIPRDMYVPIACNNNNYNKINSSAAYGTKCVINTVKNMTGIEIDYFAKINFKGVVDLVDAIGGVSVDVEVPYYRYNGGADCGENIVCEQNSHRQFGNNMIYINSGLQNLNGEQALAYARNRHQYLQGDIDRNRHQQEVLEAIAKKIMTSTSISDFEKIIDTITNNIATNMETKQILSFYQALKNMLANTLNGNDILSIQKTYLEPYGLPVYLTNAGMYTSALGYYPGSMEAIKNVMLENLELKAISLIKEFSYDYNNDNEYTLEVIGKGIRSGSTIQLMRSFIGSTVSEAESYAASNGITLYKEYTTEGNVAPGLIANQSVHQGVMLMNVKSLTIYIKEASTNNPDPDPIDPDPSIPGIPTNPEITNPNEPEPITPGDPTNP